MTPADVRWAMLDRAEAALSELLADRGVVRTSAVAAFPDVPGASIWLHTSTDSERNALNADASIQAAAMSELRASGFTEQDLSRSGVVAQSQETVDRDYEGSWFFAQR